MALQQLQGDQTFQYHTASTINQWNNIPAHSIPYKMDKFPEIKVHKLQSQVHSHSLLVVLFRPRGAGSRGFGMAG